MRACVPGLQEDVITAQMSAGIEKSGTVAVFITQRCARPPSQQQQQLPSEQPKLRVPLAITSPGGKQEDVITSSSRLSSPSHE